jgi:hypothetical protein
MHRMRQKWSCGSIWLLVLHAKFRRGKCLWSLQEGSAIPTVVELLRKHEHVLGGAADDNNNAMEMDGGEGGGHAQVPQQMQQQPWEAMAKVESYATTLSSIETTCYLQHERSSA